MVNISGAIKIVIKDNSLMAREMERVIGKVKWEENLIDIKDFMLMIKKMVKEYFIMLMVLFMKVISKMTRDVDMGKWYGQIEPHTKVIGIII